MTQQESREREQKEQETPQKTTAVKQYDLITHHHFYRFRWLYSKNCRNMKTHLSREKTQKLPENHLESCSDWSCTRLYVICILGHIHSGPTKPWQNTWTATDMQHNNNNKALGHSSNFFLPCKALRKLSFFPSTWWWPRSWHYRHIADQSGLLGVPSLAQVTSQHAESRLQGQWHAQPGMYSCDSTTCSRVKVLMRQGLWLSGIALSTIIFICNIKIILQCMI